MQLTNQFSPLSEIKSSEITTTKIYTYAMRQWLFGDILSVSVCPAIIKQLY